MLRTYTPIDIMDAYKSIATVMIDGVEYKHYMETSWDQVVTEDGVNLKDLLNQQFVDDLTKFVYRGTLQNRPGSTAIEQLYDMVGMTIGDVWLVECVRDDIVYYEMYTWLDDIAGWTYGGTTNRSATNNGDLSKPLQLFPPDLGKPNQYLVMSDDGKSITWGECQSDTDIETHNNDVNAHSILKDNILDATSVKIFQESIPSEGWIYNSTFPCYEYVFTSDNIGLNTYFELIPQYDRAADVAILNKVGFFNIFEIVSPPDAQSYAILRAKRVPEIDINVTVKAYSNSKII